MLDGNHPMAGKTLRFTVRVDDVRAATPVEIEHGHVHGEHGHHH
jgi:FKBP-type peptidyl-prolyl cis-trans isomerase SlyD